MKIDKIHVENFGKLSNLTLDFGVGLNQIYEGNGFGKTTLSVFIKAMFYGMPPARENIKMERKKYMPWQGGDFGGYIEYTTSKGKYRLTRFFGKTPESDTFELLDLSKNNVLERPKMEIGEELFEVGKETFEMTAFFPQNNILSYANNQISANILGLDKLKFDLANVNMAIENLKKKESEIKKQKPSKDEILKKKNQLLALKNQLGQLQNDLENSREEIKNLKADFKNQLNQFEVVQKQHLLQEELFATKSKIEKDLISLSAELNKLYLQQEEVDKSQQNCKTGQSKKYKAYKMITIILGMLLVLAPIVLSALAIIKPGLASGISVVFLIFTIIIYFYLDNKLNSKKDFNAESLEDQNDELAKKIDLTREAIKNTEQNLESYKNISKSDEIFYNAKEELNKTKSQLERHQIIQENFGRDIDKLIEEIDCLKDEISSLEMRDKDIANKLVILAQTKEFLSKAHQNVSARFVKPVNNAMAEIMRKFDLGDRKFVVDTNFDIMQMTEKGVKEFDYSSQGIKDILSFCMRVYFIKEIYKNEKPMIILDDTFVNLDDGNMQKANEILVKLANDYQIIYCCCHEKSKIKKS